ncbi:hypothetical protein NLG97_g4081 [Lecanicillium saksenae]|uniref:Uncharacterized protein n=1 Tax=Lecanicillium saksenae TaxID=468837 RepID=A0ACC1QWB4_9HYPO|nr:hypothetical protein NLG97_g4081 [Lecanicillium saksenae]
MTTFLLPAVASQAGPRKRTLYCVVLADIIRAAADAKDALETAEDLLLDRDGRHYSKYDAHVGETGCHIRATMLIVAFDQMRNTAIEATNQPVPSWLRDAISQLSVIRANAELLCSELTKNHKDPVAINLGSKRDYPEQIVTRLLGCQDASKFASATLCLPYIIHRLTISLARGKQPFATHCRCSDEAVWEPQDPKMLIRLLVYCYVLSKYKNFSVTSDGGRCRLSAELAAKESQRLAAPYWDQRNDDYTVPKSARVLGELTALQCWLSKLSCDWLRRLSRMTPSQHIYSQ